MGPEKVYTQKEVDELLVAQRDQIEAKHFEEQTKEVLAHINKRLDESNNYKATIGKDLRDVKAKMETFESNRTVEAEQVKQALAARQTWESKRRAWWRDWWVRAGIIGVTIWEIINIYQ